MTDQVAEHKNPCHENAMHNMKIQHKV